MQLLRDWDKAFFFLINHLPHNVFSDSFFLFFSLIGYYGIVWFGILIVLFLVDGLDNRREIRALLLALAVEIIIVEVFLKNIFIRVRPESALPDEVWTIIPKSASFSFPSGHAALSFAGAYILSIARKRAKSIFYLLAVFVSVSRLYLGKHYPSDILVGSLLGLLIGYIASLTAGLKQHVFKRIIK